MAQGSSRRRFVRSAVYASGGLLVACKTRSSFDSALESGGPGDGLRQRKPLWGTFDAAGNQVTPPMFSPVGVVDPASDLELYATAIERMLLWDTTPARNGWSDFADVHQNACPHNNWYFLPWHRGYLRHLETACIMAMTEALTERTLLDAAMKARIANWGLPYWDWSRGGHVLPPPFFKDPRLSVAKKWDTSSDPGREVTPGQSIDDSFVGAATLQKILALPDFLSFCSGRALRQRDQGTTGVLEGTPHNRTHVFVGGQMGTFLSPRDPIFWMHHCNIDRMWATWAGADVRKRVPPDVAAIDFKNKKFRNFDWGAQQLVGFAGVGARTGLPGSYQIAALLTTEQHLYKYLQPDGSFTNTGAKAPASAANLAAMARGVAAVPAPMGAPESANPASSGELHGLVTDMDATRGAPALGPDGTQMVGPDNVFKIVGAGDQGGQRSIPAFQVGDDGGRPIYWGRILPTVKGNTVTFTIPVNDELARMIAIFATAVDKAGKDASKVAGTIRLEVEGFPLAQDLAHTKLHFLINPDKIPDDFATSTDPHIVGHYAYFVHPPGAAHDPSHQPQTSASTAFDLRVPLANYVAFLQDKQSAAALPDVKSIDVVSVVDLANPDPEAQRAMRERLTHLEQYRGMRVSLIYANIG